MGSAYGAGVGSLEELVLVLAGLSRWCWCWFGSADGCGDGVGSAKQLVLVFARLMVLVLAWLG